MLLVVGPGKVITVIRVSDVAVQRANTLMYQVNFDLLEGIAFKRRRRILHIFGICHIQGSAMVGGAHLLTGNQHFDPGATGIPAIVG